MLKGIPEQISPELLKILSEMGHGDEIVLADGNFPGCSHNNRVVRADGQSVAVLLDAILKLFPLDVDSESYSFVMATDDGHVPSAFGVYNEVLCSHGYEIGVCPLPRQDFYNRSHSAYTVIATTDKTLYANIILRKGCV